MGENERTVWDDPKNATNIHLRAIDFAGLDAAFDGRFAVTVEHRRRDYGELRFDRLVELNDVILNVTFTPRGRKNRIISARLASRRERRIYDACKQAR